MMLSKIAKLVKVGRPGIREVTAPRGDIFAYEIRNLQGKPEKGEIQALSLHQAIRKLEKKAASIISLQKKIVSLSDSLRVSLKSRALMIFFKEISVMCASGVSLTRALSILENQAESEDMKRMMPVLRKAIEEGRSFSQSLDQYPGTFSQFYLSMIRAAETSGTLVSSLDYLSSVIEREIYFKEKVKASLKYPFMLMLIGMILFFTVFYWATPYLSILVKDLGAELPFYTHAILALGAYLRKSYILIPIILLLAILAFLFHRFIRESMRGRFWWERLVLGIPIIGDIVKKSTMIHAFMVLESLMVTGIPLVAAIEHAAETCDNLVLSEIFMEISRAVRDGSAIGESLNRYPGFFSRSVISMVNVGEESGEIPFIIRKIIAMHEIDLRITLESFIRVIEPLAIAALGVFAGVLILSIFVPIYLSLSNL